MPSPVSCRCDRPTPFPVGSRWCRNRPRHGQLLESRMPPPVVSRRSERPPKGPKLPSTGVRCNVDKSGSQNCRPRPLQSAGGLVKPPRRWTMLPYVVVSSMPFQLPFSFNYFFLFSYLEGRHTSTHACTRELGATSSPSNDSTMHGGWYVNYDNQLSCTYDRLVWL